MAEVLTGKFKTDTTRLFANDVINNNYYLFASSIGLTVSNNSIRSKNQFLEKTLFGKKVLNKDVFFMIKYYPWQNGLIFAQYDDTNNLDDSNFYAVVGPNSNDTGDYRVYVCLNNNFNSVVASPPNYREETIDQIYRTADGYVWKFMYALTVIEFDAYEALGFIPVIGDFDIDPVDVNGSTISDIIINNKQSNFGYTNESGSVPVSPSNQAASTLPAVPTSNWNQVDDFYTGQIVYITNDTGVSFIYEIVYYRFNAGGNPVIRVKRMDGLEEETNLVSDGVMTNATFNILPRIEILGDGIGALAVPTVNDGSIDSITLLDGGSGYNNLSVSVVDPLINFRPEDPSSADVRADIRGVLSPKNNHGYNLLEEFKCRHIILYAYITADDNNKIGAANTYGTIGFVRNPSFANTAPDIFDNRIAVVTDDIGSVNINAILTQFDDNNDIVFTGIVHDVDLSSNTMFLAEYCGPYQNVGNTDISLSTDLPFRSENGQTININTPVDENIITSEYIQRTGEVYFMEDFFPLARSELSREEFKLVLEF